MLPIAGDCPSSGTKTKALSLGNRSLSIKVNDEQATCTKSDANVRIRPAPVPLLKPVEVHGRRLVATIGQWGFAALLMTTPAAA